MLETSLLEKIERYRGLVSTSFCIENPTLADADFGDLFYYLSDRLFMMLEGSLSMHYVQRFGSRQIAIPPLHVQDAFRYVNVRLSDIGDKVIAEYAHGGGRFYPPGVDVHSMYRGALLDKTDVQCSQNVKLQRELYTFLQDREVASQLHLISDTWVDIMGIQFRSSDTKRSIPGEEERQPLVYFKINKPLDSIVKTTRTNLISEAIDASIIGTPFFADYGEAKELRGDRVRYVFSNCIHCGGGLMGAACVHCQAPFDSDLFDPWYCAPPQKVVDFLKSEGYIIPLRMGLARLKERIAPASTGPIPTVFPAGMNTISPKTEKLQ